MDEVPVGDTVYDGERRTTTVSGLLTLPDGKGGEVTYQQRIEVSQHGAGLKWDRFSGVADLLLMVLVTPVNLQEVEVRFAFTHKNYDEGSAELSACEEHMELVTGETGLEGDIPIWHHKAHLRQPLLCDGDGPIMRFRKYFNQFYIDKYTLSKNQFGEMIVHRLRYVRDPKSKVHLTAQNSTVQSNL